MGSQERTMQGYKETKTSILGWVDKIVFFVFGALLVGLGAWNLNTAHENAVGIAEVRIEILNIKNNRDIEYLREDMQDISKRLEKIEDQFYDNGKKG